MTPNSYIPADELPFEIVELDEAKTMLLKVRGLVIEKEQNTRRGWYFDYKVVAFRLSFFWLFPLLTFYTRRRLSMSTIWPGEGASSASILTPGQPSKTDTTYKISARDKGKEPRSDQKLHTVHTIEEALQLVSA